MEQLVDKVHHLEDLFNEVLDAAIEENDIRKAHKRLKEYQRVRQEIRLSLIQRSVNALPEIDDKKIREHLQRISLGEDLPNEFVRGLFQDQLDVDRIEDLSSKMLYSWFDPYEYIEGLYDIGSLVLGDGNIPTYLEELVDELRHCFVFQQYNATHALCRTVLEISIRDVYEKQGLTDPNSDNYLLLERRLGHSKTSRFLDNPDPPMAQMIGMLCVLPAFRSLKKPLRNIVNRCNAQIHGFRKVSRAEAEETLRDTILAVHALYELQLK